MFGYCCCCEETGGVLTVCSLEEGFRDDSDDETESPARTR